MNETDDASYVRVEAHGLQWQVVPDFAEVLPRVDVLRLREPGRLGKTDGTGGWQVVKDNMARTVVRVPDRVEPGAPDLFLKRFKLGKLTRRLKHLVRPTQAAKEWEVSRALQRRGVPTCRVLAVAERRPGILYREAFLISRGLPETVPLSDFLEAREWEEMDLGRRRGLIDELAELTAQMIRCGVGHDDLHLGNIMLEPDGQPGERMYVLDLHRVHVGRLSRRRITGMLVYLADSTAKRGVGAAGRVRFLRRVLERWKGPEEVTDGLVREWAKRVQKAWDRHHRRRMRSRTKRCVKNSSEFTRDRIGGFRIWHRRKMPAETALKIVDWHRMAMEGRPSRCEVRKDGPRTEISYCTDTGCGPVFVKAFLRDGIIERLKDTFRLRGRARGAWVAHRGCRVRGVPAVPGLALMEASGKLSGRPDYLLTRDVEAEADLQVLARAQDPEHPRHEALGLSGAERRELAVAVGDLFRLLAESKVRHRDMKPANILMGREEEALRLWLVDLDRTKFQVNWGRRLWVYHLAQCNAGLAEGITPLDRMRCLRRVGRGRWSERERLAIAREVLELSLTRNPEWLRGEQEGE
jgi:hypothetical protein